jgi:hypothetical protein
MAVTHTKVSVVADGGDSSLVQPSNWNANHTIADILPGTDSANDLGSAPFRWQAAYVESIRFPATAVADADANAFDDYEENTFTPGVAFGGGTTGITYTTRVGVYTKKGREVSCSITVVLSNNGSSTGAMTITGLPFASANVANQYHSATIGYYTELAPGYGTLSGIIDPGASVIRMFNGTSGTTVLTLTDVGTTDTTQLILSVTYSV